MALIDTHKAVKQFTTAGIPEKQLFPFWKRFKMFYYKNLG